MCIRDRSRTALETPGRLFSTFHTVMRETPAIDVYKRQKQASTVRTRRPEGLERRGHAQRASADAEHRASVSEMCIRDSARVPLDALSVHLHAALNRLGEITGEDTTEDVITRVFQNFCVGK